MITFRTAALDDAQRVTDLVNSAYRGEGSKRGWTTEADLLGGQRTDVEKMREEIANPHVRLELAFDSDSALIGCVLLRHEPEGVCYLGMLTVDPGLQAKGLGSQLIQHAERIAREWHCRSIRMTVVHVRQELLAFYERRGYLRSGVTSPFPSNDPRFGLPKVPLHFIELVKEF